MLRIVEKDVTNNLMTLRLDGSLIGEWVDVLRLSCEQALQRRGKLVLDLAGVTFADQEGVKLLQHLERQQVAFIHCSLFLREQIKQPACHLQTGEQGQTS